MDKHGGVQSLDRAFALLEILSEYPNGMQLSAITDRLGLNKSTVHRLLGSLIDLGYVKKIENAGGKYQLTLKLLELSGRLILGLDVINIAKPYLEKLCHSTGETVHLVTRDREDIIYIHKEENFNNSYKMVSRIGKRMEMYCTAAGKSIMAQMNDKQIEDIWNASHIHPYTNHTIIDFDRFMEEINKIRMTGIAMDNEENELGVRCIAAAIRDYFSGSNTAFSISGPAIRMTEEVIAEMIPKMQQIQKQISKELGCE